MIYVDLDRFEMASQGKYILLGINVTQYIAIAFEYERDHDASLQPFFDSSLPNLHHPEVQEWGRDLSEERVLLQSSRNPS
jgi:putative hydrolase of HD superfamily